MSRGQYGHSAGMGKGQHGHSTGVGTGQSGHSTGMGKEHTVMAWAKHGHGHGHSNGHNNGVGEAWLEQNTPLVISQGVRQINR